MSSFYDQLASLSPERRALLERKLAQQGLQAALPDTIRRRAAGTDAPLAFAQQRLWFLQQLDPHNTAYNVVSVLRLTGALDTTAMQRALHTVVERHEILRTRFVAGKSAGQPLQIVENTPADVLPLLDLGTTSDAENAAREYIARMTNAPFDLATIPLRCALLRIAQDNHLLVLTTHHIVSDRWSVGVFLRELATLYHANVRKQPSPLAALPVQYADWALWQRETLSGAELQKLSTYWTQQLAGDLPVLELPHDRPRAAQAVDDGAHFPLQLCTELSAALRALAQQKKVTLFALLLTAFKVLLHRYSDSNDIVVGTDIANRERPETADMIGLLVNTLVLRSDTSGNPPFDALLDQVRQTVLDALAHQALPFEKLVELLNPERHADQLMPLFQAKFDLQLATVRPIELDGLTLTRETPADTRTKYELRFNLQDGNDGISGQIEYSSALFDGATIARMATHFTTLLTAIVEQPQARIDDLALIDSAERKQLLFDFNQTARDHGAATTLVALFEQQVLATPDAIAVDDGQVQLSYRELNHRANHIAQALIAAGVGAETPVGICMPRSARLITGLLAILKAGGCYIPLDPDYPVERLHLIAEDARMKLLLVDALAQTMPLEDGALLQIAIDNARPAQIVDNPVARSTATQLAYVIYTSGSTGKPKGVAIEHHSAVEMLRWAQQEFGADDVRGVLVATSICFDLSVYEIFLPLSRGGRLIVVDNALALAELPADAGVTLINTVPSVLTRLLNRDGLPSSVRVVNLAGEALPPALIERLRLLGHVQRAYNLYGPSEDTTYSTWARFDLDAPLAAMTRTPIGAPITNTQAYVLDAGGIPQPLGVVGELYLGGSGLARGYLHQPELTTKSFIANPFIAEGAPSPRLYRTGDRVRRLASGALEFLGRRDDQIKIRGYRIETGEVDDVLRRHPAVREVIVSAQRIDDDLQLVAHIEADDTIDATTLRRFLQQRLPAYLVPTRLQVMSALPRLPNGKLDRRALPTATAIGGATAQAAFVAPRNALEQTLAAIWAQSLGHERVGIDDNFFELGGHSLLAIDIVARCEQALQLQLPLRALFQAPTVARLATWLSEADRTQSSAPRATLVADPVARNEPFALTAIQQAYLVGRDAAFELGNIGTHGYREIDISGIAVDAVEHALQQLIERHDMLRMVVTKDGQQRALPQVPALTIARHEIAGIADEARQQALLATRQRLSHQVFDPQQWPLFQIEATQLGNGRIRFHLSFDVLIGDAWSFQLLGREMAMLLQGHTLPPLEIGFRDYVLAEQRYEQSAPYQTALDYWRNRLATIPPAPELPLALAPSQIRAPHFTRRSQQLPAADWQRLQARAQRHGLTPSGLVLALFAETLATFSRHPAFTLNLTLFNRPPLHADINRVVGDFTSSLLLAVDHHSDAGLVANAQKLQAQLWNDLEHRAVSGVQVQRELARQQQRSAGALMPVVFTSTLNQSARRGGVDEWQAEIVHGVSQTSQVYLDHQVSEIDGALHCNWDAIDALFPAGLLDAICAHHENRLRQLAAADASDADWLQRMDSRHVAPWLDDFNRTSQPLLDGSGELLHELFFTAAQKFAQRDAVITRERVLDYAALAEEVKALAQQLVSAGVKHNELVAISIAKGWQQVVATLGVLAAGAAYVPIDPALPAARRHELLADTQARVLLSTANCTLDWPGSVNQLRIEAGARADNAVSLPVPQPTDLAYVIYTSGSTGMPKGVMIDHRGAVNTVLDINRRHGIDARDRVFGLSSLSFDLSVYDVFGTLATGAALVLPDADKLQQPEHWLDLVQRHGVSVWNSVPALMQLLVDVVPASGSETGLRLAMLSGDWIALTLPDAIRAKFPNARVISMGGATEASIWSIDYPIADVDPAWRSVPYGRPLANQQWYVVDDNFNPRPAWVPGQLCIGGIGVARGYWRRQQLTAERFVPNPFAGSGDAANTLMYRTGDLGFYRPDGTIEFLGREDNQVKINGYRVEPGEIEAVLQQHPALVQAAVAVHGTPPSLTAYVVPALMGDDASSENTNPLSRLDFKQEHRGWREAGAGDVVIALPRSAIPKQLLQRQSHRRFASRNITLDEFSRWLETLRAWPMEQIPLPKYRYPSAGNLYPLRAYIEIKPARINGLDAGWYYYHPGEHHLQKLALAPAAAGYGPNQSIYDDCAFAVFLVAQVSAIKPLYGAQARDFALLEAGYASQLLFDHAAEHKLGLCPIGGASLASVGAQLQLDTDQQLLHGLLGGAIEPAWNDHWQAMSASGNGGALSDNLRNWLRQRLPAYMVPARFRLLKTLPLSANGKLDRKALPAPDIEQVQYVAPVGDTEHRIAALWQELLRAERIGMADDFFAVGGNSLIAMQLMNRLREEFSVALTLGQLLDALTPGAQAKLIATLTPAETTAAITRIERADDSVDLSALADDDVDAMLAQLLAQDNA